MSLLNIFKKEKEVKSAEKKTEGKAEEKEETKQPETDVLLFYGALKAPHLTEKANILAESGQYVFKVNKKVSKNEIKKAVGEIYKVKVESVRIINLPRKPRRSGKRAGWKKAIRKAVVKLTKGQKIEILSA